MTRTRIRRLVFGMALVFSGVVLGVGLTTLGAREVERARMGATAMTDPFLEPAGERDRDARLNLAFREIRRFIQERQEADSTLDVSVYARDLIDGQWSAVNERRPYQPASLMKVAILFHALARMEADPTLRARMIVYPGPAGLSSPDNMSERPPSERMTPGASYRFDDLVARMIMYSDNHAKDLVLLGVDAQDVDRFMAAIGVPKLVDAGRAVMDAHSYGILFRILYHSTVFSRPTSEFALDVLRRAVFRDGIRAPLPSDVRVASKFGVYFDPADPTNGLQVHECGIVYAPTSPYVLCVMTQSNTQSPDALKRILSEISRLIYEARAG